MREMIDPFSNEKPELTFGEWLEDKCVELEN